MIPIRTETSVRHVPIANLLLLSANIASFLLLDYAATPGAKALKESFFILDGYAPRVHQFITYQFAHADAWHLAGNLLFLWVFGNSVNAKMGDVAYLLFYLAGGICAGIVFNHQNPHALLGASGSIAAVTTAYMVLFPRSHVTVLIFFFLITFIEVPAILVIGVKIVLWDNVIAPYVHMADNQVAHSAHMAGYVFGFISALVMLLIRAVPRDQYDMLALLKRWNQRREYHAMMRDPAARARAEFGRVGQAAPQSAKARADWNRSMDERTGLRARIAEHLQRGDADAAARDYEQLVAAHPDQCLPADQQLLMGRYYYGSQRPAQAAAAFERYLGTYPSSSESNEVRLLLGILFARDLRQDEQAERLLGEAMERAATPSRRELAAQWLSDVRARRLKPST